MSDEVVYVVPRSVNDGTCTYCRRPIVWATVARQGPGRPARSRPFDRRPTLTERATLALDHPPAAEDAAAAFVLEPWPAALLHGKNCSGRPKPDPTRRRMRRTSRDGQGRIF